MAVPDAYGTPYQHAVERRRARRAGQRRGRARTRRRAGIDRTPNGTLTLSADGAFAYTPNLGFAGIDSFAYRADTSVGTGNTVTVTIVVAEPTTVQPPRELRASSMAGSVVTFRWKAPPVGPSAGGIRAGGRRIAGPAPGVAGHRAVGPNLRGDGSERVVLRADPSLGTGGPSDVSNEILIHVGVPVPPSPPSAFQATAAGNRVHLSWTPTFGGGAPSSFMLDVAGSVSASLPLPLLERVSFAGAPAGSYTLAVRAVNGAGTSDPSAPVAMTVPGACAGPTGPPSNLLAYVNGGTTFVVWDPPTSGEAVSSYVISVPGIGGFALAQRSISGPLPAGSYVINVQAVGPCGTSHRPCAQALTVP